MTTENDFIPFAVGANANVVSQASYAANTPTTQTGFMSGVAQSSLLNKVWRQSSIMAAVLADLIVAQTGQPAIDDGTTATLLANLEAAITAVAASTLFTAITDKTSAGGNYVSGGTIPAAAKPTTVSFCLTGAGDAAAVVINGTAYANILLVNATTQQVSFLVPAGATYGITWTGELTLWKETQ